MNKVYQWEVQPMEETLPYIIFTNRDSIGDAARQFEENNGRLSIRYIRKIAIVDKIDYTEYDESDWKVS